MAQTIANLSGGGRDTLLIEQGADGADGAEEHSSGNRIVRRPTRLRKSTGCEHRKTGRCDDPLEET